MNISHLHDNNILNFHSRVVYCKCARLLIQGIRLQYCIIQNAQSVKSIREYFITLVWVCMHWPMDHYVIRLLMIRAGPLTSAWIPSIIAPFPRFPTASFKWESIADVFSGYSLGKTTVARKVVVPCFGKTPWVCSEKKDWVDASIDKKITHYKEQDITQTSTWVQPEIQYITTATCNQIWRWWVNPG